MYEYTLQQQTRAKTMFYLSAIVELEITASGEGNASFSNGIIISVNDLENQKRHCCIILNGIVRSLPFKYFLVELSNFPQF